MTSYDAEKYYQKVNADKSLKIKSSAYYRMGLWNSSGITKKTTMPDGTVVPVSLQSLYVGNQGFNGHEIMTATVVNSIIPRALRYALLYNYFGYPVANISIGDKQTSNYLNNQDNKWIANSSVQYPEKIIPRGNLAYIMPFNYGGKTEPNFYGTTYLQYCEEYHNGEFEYSNIWEADEGLPSLGSYYDLAKKAQKSDPEIYSKKMYAYLRGDSATFGNNYAYCRVDPVSVDYSMGHYLTLGSHRVSENKSDIEKLVYREYESGEASSDLPGVVDKYYEDSTQSDYFIVNRQKESSGYYDEEGSLDPAYSYPLNIDDGLTIALMYNVSLKSYASSLKAAHNISNNTLYYFNEDNQEKVITNDLLYPMSLDDFSTILISPPIASVQFAKSVLKQTSDQLYDSITNPLTKTWAKAFIPSLMFPTVGGQPHQQAAELGIGSMIPASLASLGLGSYGPGQDMQDIMGKYAQSAWYESYNSEKVGNSFVLPGSVSIGNELQVQPIDSVESEYTENFRYSNIATAFKLVPKAANTQEEAQYYLENPNETLNAVVPKIFDYVNYVVSSNISKTNNDSLKGVKRFRLSGKNPEKLSSAQINSSLVHNTTIGNKADDKGDEAFPLYGFFGNKANTVSANTLTFDTALFGRVIYQDLQNDVLEGKLSYMYRRKPDNFMLIPADTLTLKTMLEEFPKDKDYGPMGDVNTVPEIYNNFINALNSGFESYASGFTGDPESNVTKWEGYFNPNSLENAYGSDQLDNAKDVYARVYRNVQACKFMSDKFLVLKYKTRPRGSSGLLGYYDPEKDFAGGVSPSDWYPSSGYITSSPSSINWNAGQSGAPEADYGTGEDDSFLTVDSKMDEWTDESSEKIGSLIDDASDGKMDPDDFIEEYDVQQDYYDAVLEEIYDQTDLGSDIYEEDYEDYDDYDNYVPNEDPPDPDKTLPPDIDLIQELFQTDSLSQEQEELLEGFYFAVDGYGETGGSQFFKPGQSIVAKVAYADDSYWYGTYFKGWSVEDESKLKFPVWNYTQEYLSNVAWNPLIRTPEDEQYYADAIAKYPSFKNRINYGIPDWVKSFSIYPSIERSTHSVGLPVTLFPTADDSIAQKVASAELSTAFNEGEVLNNIGTYSSDPGTITDVNDNVYDYEFSSFYTLFPNAYEVDATMLTYKTADGHKRAGWPWMKIKFSYNPASQSGNYSIELRYVVELEIDESKLIADLVGYGVFNLAGSLDKYVDQGFDPYDLLLKSNGNIVEDTELYEQYENYVSNLGSGDGSVDFSQFPWYDVSTDEDAVDVSEKEQQLISEFGEEYTNAYVFASTGQTTVPLKEFPGNGSNNIGYLDNLTFVKITKEWVNGKGEFNKVIVTDPDSAYNESTGYVETELLRPSPSAKEKAIFFEDKFPNLSLAQTEVQFMSRAAKAFIPTWYNMDTPYYHKGDAEYWLNVYLPDDQTCVLDNEDLETKKQLAIELGIKEILDFLNKEYTDQDVQDLKNTYLAARVEDGAENYHINLRPGDPIQILVKIGAIYVKAFNSKLQSLKQLKAQSDHIISLDTRFYQQHISHAVYSLNRIHLDISYSPFTTQGFNAIKEAKRLTYVPVAIKKMIALNGYDVTNNGANLINVGFDSNYKLVFMSYKEGNGQEKLLETGFNFYKKTEPFNYPNTMSLFYHHRLLKDPTLPWQTVLEQFLIDPKPKIVQKQIGDFSGISPSNRCSPPQFIYPDWQDILRGLADRLDLALDLDPRFDLGSFQFSLLELFPPCPKPPSGKGVALYQVLGQVGAETALYQGTVDADINILKKNPNDVVFKEGVPDFFETYDGVDFDLDFQDEVIAGMKKQIDETKEYVGDYFSSGEGLKDLKAKIFDLDDLYTYVLNYIDPATLYSRICKCFLDLTGFESFKAPNFEIGYDNLSAGMKLQPGKALYAELSGDPIAKAELKEDVYSGPGGLKEFGQKKTWSDAGKLTIPGRDPGVEIDTSDLFCSFCFNIPSVFFRLPTTNILDEFLKALKALLEFAIAQLLLELITLALEILLSCPEIQCPAGAENLKDYGATNLNEVFDNSGINALDALNNCGLLQDNVIIAPAILSSFMDDVSSRLSSVEVLGLLDGTPTNKTLKSIQATLKMSYPELEAQLNNKAKIEDFFTCVGLKMPVSVVDQIEASLENNFKDPIYCENLESETTEKLLDKCGTAFDAQEVLKQSQQFDVEKYVEIANIFRETDDLSTQLPPFFSDGGGVQGIMSQLTDKLPTMNYALDTAIDTAIIPIESSLTRETKNYVDAKKNILVKQDDQDGRFGLIENVLNRSKWTMGLRLFQTGTQWRAHNLVNNVDSIFASIFDSSKIVYSSVNETVKLKAGTGDDYENNYVQFNFSPPKFINGVRDYSNNYKLQVNYDTPSIPSKTVTEILSKISSPSNSSGNYPSIYSYPKRSQLLTVQGDLNELGPSVQQFIKQFPLSDEPALKSKSEQSQTFLNLLIGGIFRGGENLQDAIEVGIGDPNSKKNASQWLVDYNNSDKIQSLITNQVYFGTLMGIISSYTDGLSKNGLLGVYDDNPMNDDELALAFNLAPLLAMTTAIPGLSVIIYQSLTKNLYRREIERLDLTPTQAMGGVPHQSLINYEQIRKIIKQNYDISKYYDPNSMELGPMHLALLEGWASAMCQMFAGEVFLKGVFSLSLIPKEILLADKMIVDFIFEEMNYWLDLPRNSSFKPKFVEIVNTIVANKPEWKYDNEITEGEFAPTPGDPGNIFDTNSGLQLKINDWTDATKYFIRNNLLSPLSFVQQRVQSLEPIGNPAPELFNPIEAITHSSVIEILEGFGAQKDINLPFGSANSLCSQNRIDEFKNGKFFFQYYFNLTELQTGSDKYNALIEKLLELDLKYEVKGNPSNIDFLQSIITIVNTTEFGGEVTNGIIENIINSFRWNRPTVDRGHVSRDSMTRNAKNFYTLFQDTDAVFKEVLQIFYESQAENPDNPLEIPEDIEFSSEFADNLIIENPGAISLTDESIEDIKKFIKFEDLFEKVEIGTRLCYGFSDSDMTFAGNRIIPLSAPDPIPDSLEDIDPDDYEGLAEAFGESSSQKPIQSDSDDKQAKTFRNLAGEIDELIDEDDNFWSSSLGVKSKIYKCFRIRENASSPPGTTDEYKNVPLDNYIFPLIQANKDILDDNGPLPTVKQWMSQNLGTLTDQNFQDYEDYDDVMLYLSLDGSFKNVLKDLTSEITLSPAYSTLFRYSMPISKMLYLICLYNVLEISSDMPCNVAFEETKTVLKETIETIYEMKGKDAYKHQSTYEKQKGGAIGIASFGNKIK